MERPHDPDGPGDVQTKSLFGPTSNTSDATEKSNEKAAATRRRRSSALLTAAQKSELEEKLASLAKKHDVWIHPAVHSFKRFSFAMKILGCAGSGAPFG
jgi:hypothetical protein